jgi:hypothetical protein
LKFGRGKSWRRYSKRRRGRSRSRIGEGVDSLRKEAAIRRGGMS